MNKITKRQIGGKRSPGKDIENRKIESKNRPNYGTLNNNLNKIEF